MTWFCKFLRKLLKEINKSAFVKRRIPARCNVNEIHGLTRKFAPAIFKLGRKNVTEKKKEKKKKFHLDDPIQLMDYVL